MICNVLKLPQSTMNVRDHYSIETLSNQISDCIEMHSAIRQKLDEKDK